MNFLNEVKQIFNENYSLFLFLVETSEGDSLLLSVIEAYCITSANSGTSIAGLNTLIAKARHSISATGMICSHYSPSTDGDRRNYGMSQTMTDILGNASAP